MALQPDVTRASTAASQRGLANLLSSRGIYRARSHRIDGNATCCLMRIKRFSAQPDERGEHMMNHDVVFLLDVDNTLLDADRVTIDLGRYLEKAVGQNRQQR